MRTDSQPVKNSNESGTARPNKDARGNSIRRVNREPGGKKNVTVSAGTKQKSCSRTSVRQNNRRRCFQKLKTQREKKVNGNTHTSARQVQRGVAFSVRQSEVRVRTGEESLCSNTRHSTRQSARGSVRLRDLRRGTCSVPTAPIAPLSAAIMSALRPDWSTSSTGASWARSR